MDHYCTGIIIYPMIRLRSQYVRWRLLQDISSRKYTTIKLSIIIACLVQSLSFSITSTNSLKLQALCIVVSRFTSVLVLLSSFQMHCYKCLESYRLISDRFLTEFLYCDFRFVAAFLQIADLDEFKILSKVIESATALCPTETF